MYACRVKYSTSQPFKTVRLHHLHLISNEFQFIALIFYTEKHLVVTIIIIVCNYTVIYNNYNTDIIILSNRAYIFNNLIVL